MKRKKNFCCTLLIIVLILSIGIGYAYLSSELNFTLSTASISPYVRLCKRATTFHSETCTSSSITGYCYAGGTSITYGQIGSIGTLTSGDAFDCDVNGDGNINALDYVKIKNHIMNTKKITGDVFILSADYNNDGKISALDYVRIKNYIMNGGK